MEAHLPLFDRGAEEGPLGSRKNVKRYSNGGRISQVYDNLTGAQKHEAAQAEKWINKILEHGKWDGNF